MMIILNGTENNNIAIRLPTMMKMVVLFSSVGSVMPPNVGPVGPMVVEKSIAHTGRHSFANSANEKDKYI